MRLHPSSAGSSDPERGKVGDMPIETSPAPFQDEQAGYPYAGSAYSMSIPIHPAGGSVQPMPVALQGHTPAAAAANTMIAAEPGAMATPFRAIPALPEAGYTAPVQHAHRFDPRPLNAGLPAEYFGGWHAARESHVGGGGGALEPGMDNLNMVPAPRPSIGPGSMGRSFSMPVRAAPLPLESEYDDYRIANDHHQHQHQHHHHGPQRRVPEQRHLQVPHHRDRDRDYDYDTDTNGIDCIDGDARSDCSYYALPKCVSSTRRPRHLSGLGAGIAHGTRGASRSRRYSDASALVPPSGFRFEVPSYAMHDDDRIDDDDDADYRNRPTRPRIDSLVSPRQVEFSHSNLSRAAAAGDRGRREKGPGQEDPPESPLQNYMRRLKIHDEREELTLGGSHSRDRSGSRRPSRPSSRVQVQGTDIGVNRGAVSDTEVVRPVSLSRLATDTGVLTTPGDSKNRSKGNTETKTRSGTGASKAFPDPLPPTSPSVYRTLPKETVARFAHERRQSEGAISHRTHVRSGVELAGGVGEAGHSDAHNLRPRIKGYHSDLPAPASAMDMGMSRGRRRHGSLGSQDDIAQQTRHRDHSHSHSHSRSQSYSQQVPHDRSPGPHQHQHQRQHYHTHLHPRYPAEYAGSYASSASYAGGAGTYPHPVPQLPQGAQGHGQGFAPIEQHYDYRGQDDHDHGPPPGLAPLAPHLNPLMPAPVSTSVSADGTEGRVSQYGLPKYPHQPKVDYRRFMVQRGNADVYLD